VGASAKGGLCLAMLPLPLLVAATALAPPASQANWPCVPPAGIQGMMQVSVAVQLAAPGDFSQVENIGRDIPAPAVAGQVMIRVMASSVNPLDYQVIATPLTGICSLKAGQPSAYKQLCASAVTAPKCAAVARTCDWTPIPPDPDGPGAGLRFPHNIGHDVAGTVVACPNCRRLKVGDKVWADLGERWRLRGGELGAYSQCAIADETQVSLIPALWTPVSTPVTWAAAASIPLAGLTAVQALRQAGAPWVAGARVLITDAAGGTGHLAIQIAKSYGAHVTAIGPATDAYFLRQLGADVALSADASDAFANVPAASLDAVLDVLGAPGTAELAMAALKPGGTFIFLPGRGGALAKQPKPGVNQLKFAGVTTTNYTDLDLLKQLVDRRKLTPHVQQVFPLTQVSAAFNLSYHGAVRGKLGIVLPISHMPPPPGPPGPQCAGKAQGDCNAEMNCWYDVNCHCPVPCTNCPGRGYCPSFTNAAMCASDPACKWDSNASCVWNGNCQGQRPRLLKTDDGGGQDDAVSVASAANCSCSCFSCGSTTPHDGFDHCGPPFGPQNPSGGGSPGCGPNVGRLTGGCYTDCAAVCDCRMLSAHGTCQPAPTGGCVKVAGANPAYRQLCMHEKTEADCKVVNETCTWTPIVPAVCPHTPPGPPAPPPPAPPGPPSPPPPAPGGVCATVAGSYTAETGENITIVQLGCSVFGCLPAGCQTRLVITTAGESWSPAVGSVAGVNLLANFGGHELQGKVDTTSVSWSNGVTWQRDGPPAPPPGPSPPPAPVAGCDVSQRATCGPKIAKCIPEGADKGGCLDYTDSGEHEDWF
jgi:NADPH:quinone reductase-like Zn-dependent oxidoreductase